jgi:hypothetical protein
MEEAARAAGEQVRVVCISTSQCGPLAKWIGPGDDMADVLLDMKDDGTVLVGQGDSRLVIKPDGSTEDNGH